MPTIHPRHRPVTPSSPSPDRPFSCALDAVSSPRLWTELCTRFVANDRKAFDQIVTVYRTQLAKVAQRTCGMRYGQDAEDVLQDGLANAWIHRADFAGSTAASLFAWLWGFVRFAGIGHVRDAQREARHVQLMVEADDIDNLVDPNDGYDRLACDGSARALRRAIVSLPPSASHLLWMHIVEEQSEQEIARALALRPRTLRRRLAAATVLARRAITRHGIVTSRAR